MSRIWITAVRSPVGVLAVIALLSWLANDDSPPAGLSVSVAAEEVPPLKPPASHVFTTGGRMDSFAFDPVGKTLATAGWTGPEDDHEGWKAGTNPGDLHLFDVATGKEIAHFDEECGAIFDVAFSPDGQSLATAGRVPGSPNLGEVRIWNVALRKTLITIRSQIGWSLSIAYSPDGLLIASGGFDRMVRVWDARTGKEIKVLGQPSTASSLMFSADGKTLVAGCRGGTLLLWDVPTWKERARFENEKMYLLGADISADGRFVAAGGPLLGEGGRIDMRGVLRIWDVNTGKEHRAWEVDGHLANKVRFSPDGQFLAAAHGECSISNVETGARVALIPRSSSSAADQIHFSPDGKTLAIGSFRRVQLWDVSGLWPDSKP